MSRGTREQIYTSKKKREVGADHDGTGPCGYQKTEAKKDNELSPVREKNER